MHCTAIQCISLHCTASCINPAFALISAPIGQGPLSFLAFQRNQIKSQANPIDTNIRYRLCRTRTEIMGNKSGEPIQIAAKTN